MHADHLTIRHQPNFEASFKGFALLSTGPLPSSTAVTRCCLEMKSLSHGLARELRSSKHPQCFVSLHSRLPSPTRNTPAIESAFVVPQFAISGFGPLPALFVRDLVLIVAGETRFTFPPFLAFQFHASSVACRSLQPDTTRGQEPRYRSRTSSFVKERATRRWGCPLGQSRHRRPGCSVRG